MSGGHAGANVSTILGGLHSSMAPSTLTNMFNSAHGVPIVRAGVLRFRSYRGIRT